MTKTCIECGVDKAMTEFPRNGRDKTGATAYRADCRDCYSVRRGLKKTKIGKFLSSTKVRTGEIDTYSLDDWKKAMVFFKGGCAYCGVKPSRRSKKNKMTKEHVVPVSKGGKTVLNNIVPGCTRCNCSKGDREVSEWYRKQTFFDEGRLEAVRQWQEQEPVSSAQ